MKEPQNHPPELELEHMQAAYNLLKSLYEEEITLRQRTEDHYLQQEARFRLMVEYSSDILVFIDRNGIQQYISPSVEQITGYPVTELLSRSFKEVIHPDDAERVIKSFEELVKNPELILKVTKLCGHYPLFGLNNS